MIYDTLFPTYTFSVLENTALRLTVSDLVNVTDLNHMIPSAGRSYLSVILKHPFKLIFI